ncbi:MAG: phage tail protein, partial [Treponema sp.]|nr:phage tail protein [Treponema sp.]
DGIETVSFIECTGLAAEATVYEVEEGGYNTSTHKFIGQNRYSNLVLRKGIGKSNLLQKWCKSWFNQGDNDKVERKTISVVFYNSARKEMFRLNLFKCLPCRWKVEALDVKDNSYAIEMLEIAYESMEIDETEDMSVNPFQIGQDTSGSQLTDTMREVTLFLHGGGHFVSRGAQRVMQFDSLEQGTWANAASARNNHFRMRGTSLGRNEPLSNIHNLIPVTSNLTQAQISQIRQLGGTVVLSQALIPSGAHAGQPHFFCFISNPFRGSI